MKKLFLVVLIFPFFAQAQIVTDSSRFKTFLYEHFVNGYVLMKNGAVEEAPLNYNSEDQSIYFIKEGKYMVLSGLESVDTIYLKNKKFIPVKESIYEVISDPSSSTVVYVNYTNIIRPLVATADHNGSVKQTPSQVSNTVTDVYANGIGKNKSVEIQKHYWIERKKKMYRADSEKQVTKIIPAKASAIEKFVKENNISFFSDADMLKLAAFCSTLN